MQRVSCQIAVYIAKLKRWKIACVHYLTLPYHINGKFKIEIRSLIWVSYCISLWCSLCVCLFVWFFFFLFVMGILCKVWVLLIVGVHAMHLG